MIKIKKFSSVGIVGYGAYLPYWRIKVKEIANVWQKNPAKIKQSLGVEKKAIADKDEDCLTMAVEASQPALKKANIKPSKIGAVFVGSESHPYAVKPTGTILAEILGIGNEYFCADLEFACKAATAGLQITAGLIESGLIDYGLVVGSDKAQASKGDVLEYTAAAGAAAFVLGRKKSNFLAELVSTYSFATDTPDFWRRQGCLYPSHAGRFTGEPGYFYHIQTCGRQFLKKINKRPSFFDYVVFHMPNAKFPLKIAKILGFTQKQLEPGFIVPKIGNPYSASSLLGFIAVLEQAEAGKNVLLFSYGSGAGSDAFWFKTKKPKTKKLKAENNQLKNYFKENQEIDYLAYLKNYGGWE